MENYVKEISNNLCLFHVDDMACIKMLSYVHHETMSMERVVS